MANPEHLIILLQGVEVWNKWREENPEIIPDLRGAYLEGIYLERANLSQTDFYDASLCEANLKNTNLENANLQKANLSNANLEHANLKGAYIFEANLEGASLKGANPEAAIFDSDIDKEKHPQTIEDLFGKPGFPEIEIPDEDIHGSQVDRTKEEYEKPEPRYNNQEWDEIEKDSSDLEHLIELDKNEKGINWNKIIKEEIEKLPIGQILFNVPISMKIGKKERIEVRISQDLTKDITKNLKGRGIPEIEISKVGNFMKVKLSGDKFKINPLNEEEQIVAKDTYTEWAWDVVPLKSKTQVLHFHVTIRLKIEGTEEKRDYPVIDKEVYVKVNPVYSTKVFAANNWKWILTALLIPLAGWIVRMVLK